ncbi:hypothetical protein JHD50_04855 [Sulfurimonas sp. MAG313]|nr:hypothetical protein [Sulfurimonas sp. MAG313]MDF1880638.1 hypothetical protein [Sulfurimonas sp. MAG313]
MKFITLLLLLYSFSQAIVTQETQECKTLYTKANSYWLELTPLLKTKIASQYSWGLIDTYLNLASQTIGKCETSGTLNFRSLRELKQGMQRADKLRNSFWVQTYNEMVAKARQEGRCTNIYNSYGHKR